MVSERDEALRVAAELNGRIRAVVVRLRLDAVSWTEIGAALGISRQGARQRFAVAAQGANRTRGLRPDATPLAQTNDREGSQWTSWRP